MTERELIPDLIALLVCPGCRRDLQDVKEGLLCQSCGLLYPIVNGVPVMVREHAKAYPETSR